MEKDCLISICKKALWLFALLISLLQVNAGAQSVNDLSINFTEQSLTASNQELINLTVKIKNRGKKSLLATTTIQADAALELISRPSRIIRINPGDSLFLPTKLFISADAQSAKDYLITAELADSARQPIGTAVAKLQVIMKKKVTFFPQVSSILLQGVSDSIRIPIRVQNLGNTAQKISLVVNYPNVFEATDFQKDMQLTIPAGSDTLVYSTRIVSKKMFGSDGFDINIAGLYANGELFEANYVRVQNAKNDRSYQERSITGNADNNSISLGTQGMGSPNQLYLLMGRGDLKLPQGSMAYNFDLTVYRNSSALPSMLRNTYLGYEVRNMGLRAGNINKNMDINIMGKGGEFYILDTARDNKYEAGYVKNSVNLLGERFQNFFSDGEAAWGSFSHAKKSWSVKSGAIYQNNNFLGTRNLLINNQFGFVTKQFQYVATVNAGRIDHQQNGPLSDYGYAGSMDIMGNFGNFSISSNNFISTKYYPGIRQGATNLSQRIMHKGSSLSSWLAVDYYKYAPANIGMFSGFNTSFDNLNAEVGFSYKILKKLTLSFAPNYRSETNSAIILQSGAQGSATLNSWNLGTTLNIPISSGQYFTFNSLTGYYNSSLASALEFHSRLSTNYHYQFLNVNVSIQQGAFYVGEIVNNLAIERKSALTINVSPTLQRTFFRGKLKADAGLNYYSDNFFGKNLQVNCRAEAEIIPRMLVYGGINSNSFYSGLQDYRANVFELGITKKLTGPKIGSKNGTLQAMLFKDINENGIYDADLDSLASGFLVYVNDVIFISGKDGLINYKNLPPGEYRVSVPKLKGWHAPDQRINFEKKERLEIALQKTGTLKGMITYDYNEFSYEIGQQKEGLTIVAENESGQSFVTRTNSDGSYIFFIPTGRYLVRVNTDYLPAEIESVQGDQHTMLAAGEVKSLNLTLNVKQRKIETKRFSSPSLRKRK